VLGDPVAERVAFVEQLGRLPVAEGAFPGGELLVDRGSDDRVHERQGTLRRQDPGGDQVIRGGDRLLDRESREPGGMRELGALEHRYGACQVSCRSGQATEAHEHPAADRPAAHAANLLGGGIGGRHAGLPKRDEELADQERRAPSGVAAGRDETGVGRRGQLRADQLSHCVMRQGRRACELGQRVRCQTCEQPVARTAVARARGHQDGGRQLAQPLEEEGEVAQGRDVSPVRIVDNETQRGPRAEVRAQPVEAVKDREGGVGRRHGLCVADRAGQTE
jgi:hypothetical protein